MFSMISAKITSKVLACIFWTFLTLTWAFKAYSSTSETSYERPPTLSFLGDYAFLQIRWQSLQKFSISSNLITSSLSYDFLWSKIKSRELLPSTIDLMACCDLSEVSIISAILLETGSRIFFRIAFSTMLRVVAF